MTTVASACSNNGLDDFVVECVVGPAGLEPATKRL
jgi:hypothetical protein